MSSRYLLLLILAAGTLSAGLVASAARSEVGAEATGISISEDLDLPLVLARGDRFAFGLRTGAPLPPGVAAGGEDSTLPSRVLDLKLELTVGRPDSAGGARVRLAISRRTSGDDASQGAVSEGQQGDAGGGGQEPLVTPNELVHEADIDAAGRITSLRRVEPMPTGELDLSREQVRLWLEHILGSGLHGRTLAVDDLVRIGDSATMEASAARTLTMRQESLSSAYLLYEGLSQPSGDVVARFSLLLPIPKVEEATDEDGEAGSDEQRLRAAGLAHYNTEDGLLQRLRFRSPTESVSEVPGSQGELEPEDFLQSIQESDVGGGPWLLLHRLDTR